MNNTTAKIDVKQIREMAEAFKGESYPMVCALCDEIERLRNELKACNVQLNLANKYGCAE